MLQPQLWIVAGPNGSGKSTLYGRDTDFEIVGKSVWIINPDLLTARLVDVEKLEQQTANIAALNRIMDWLQASIATHQTIGVETVLSSDKYRALVETAKARGYEVRLIYVMVQDAATNIARVATRVRTGGHNVPTDRIVQRRARSLAQLPWFLHAADLALLLDNTQAEPRLMGEKTGGVITLYDGAFPELRAAAEQAKAMAG